MLKELVALRELQRKVDHALEHSEKEKKATSEDAKVKLELHNQLQLLVDPPMFVEPNNVLLVTLRTQNKLVTIVLNSDLLSRCMKKPFANFHQTGSVPSFYRRSSERAVLGRDPGQYQYQVHQVVSNILHFQVVHDCQNDSAASYKV